MRSSIKGHAGWRAGGCTPQRTFPCTPMNLALVAVWLAAGACSREDRTPAAREWRAHVDTVGDTITVRTVAGSEWGAAELVPELRIGALEGADHEIFGEIIALTIDAADNIYIYDRQVPALRKYAPDGRYLATFGREGGGPGEYANSDGGLAALANGRIVLRDPGNARFTVYAPDGGYLESWPTRGGAFTSTPIFPSADGGFYSPVFGGGQPMRLVRYAPDGTPGDTLPLPYRRVERATVSAQVEGASQTWSVPFSETALWTWHPEGYYISAVNRRYAIDLLRRDRRVLRLMRDVEPTRVTSEERAAQEDRVSRAMRRLDPSWRWNGPPIPGTKPILRTLYAGADGRIWALLYQPSERVADDEPEPGPDGRPPVPQFREPTVFDVFEKDGRYLGRVAAPAAFSTGPRPFFRGDNVWSTERDEFGVQYVVKYRIATAREPPSH